MKAMHIRGVSEETVEALKTRAARNHRSLQGEVRLILEEAARSSRPAPKASLALHTVATGRTGPFRRDDFYDDDSKR